MHEQQFLELLHREEGKLFCIAWGILGQESDAWDVLQQTVEGKNPASITQGLGRHDILFNGRFFASGMGARAAIMDGVFVGSIELSDGLSEESGTLKLPVRQIGNVHGTDL